MSSLVKIADLVQMLHKARLNAKLLLENAKLKVEQLIKNPTSPHQT
jgi:hypothetical protein